MDNVAVPAADYTLTDVSGGVNLSYTPKTALTDGSHTITASCSDNDGNASTTASVTYKQDTTPPALTVNQPTTPTNKSACTITGKTSDATSSPVTVKVTLNGADQGAVTVDANGNFSKALTLREGDNTIVVRATWTQLTTANVTSLDPNYIKFDPSLAYPWFTDISYTCSENDTIRPKWPIGTDGIGWYVRVSANKLRTYADSNKNGTALTVPECEKG